MERRCDVLMWSQKFYIIINNTAKRYEYVI